MDDYDNNEELSSVPSEDDPADTDASFTPSGEDIPVSEPEIIPQPEEIPQPEPESQSETDAQPEAESQPEPQPTPSYEQGWYRSGPYAQSGQGTQTTQGTQGTQGYTSYSGSQGQGYGQQQYGAPQYRGGQYTGGAYGSPYGNGAYNGRTYNRSAGQAPYPGQTPYQGTGYTNGQPYYGAQPTPPVTPPVQPTTPPTPQKKSGKAGKIIFFIIVAAILIGAIVAAATLISKHKNNPGSGNNTPVTQKDDSAGEKPDSDISFEIAPPAESGALPTDQIAEKARKSNVGIIVYTANTTREAGQGTGILAKEENGETYVLTCAHVINDSGISCKVQLEDGTTYDAEIVGFDSRTDVGVVKIKATGLGLAEFGDSSALKVGSSVYAVGNPGGIQFFGSFTAGMVSAIDRPIDSEIGYTMTCIQHTAAINPGNSGGALVNVYGQVIGINSQKIAASDFEGMGFSIPINSALEIATDLIKYHYVPNRAKLGITYYSVSASQQYSMIAQFNQLPAGTLIINSISPDSSLANTQAQQYDMIIAVDGKELSTADTLLELIDNGKVGDKHTLTLARVNSNYTLEKFDIEITLVEDKGDSEATEEPTTAFNPFDFFYDFGY